MEDCPVKDIDEASAITIEMAKCLVTSMRAMAVEWRTAYVRIQFIPGVQECKGCYVSDSEVQLFDVFKHKPMIASLQALGERLRDATSNNGRQFCVALLEVSSALDYEIHYEWQDASRWRISKLNGGSGMPEGLLVQ